MSGYRHSLHEHRPLGSLESPPRTPAFTRPFLKIREAPSEEEVLRHCGGRRSPHGGTPPTPSPHPPTWNCFSPLHCSGLRQQDSSVRDLAPFLVPHQTGTSPGGVGCLSHQRDLWGNAGAGLSPVDTLVPPGHRSGPRRRDFLKRSGPGSEAAATGFSSWPLAKPDSLVPGTLPGWARVWRLPGLGARL